RFRSDLHQTERIGGRHSALVERALLTRDRIDDAHFDPRSDRLVIWDADGRERIVLERKAVREAPLAKVQGGARILVADRRLADRREDWGIVRTLAELCDRGRDQIA